MGVKQGAAVRSRCTHRTGAGTATASTCATPSDQSPSPSRCPFSVRGGDRFREPKGNAQSCSQDAGEAAQPGACAGLVTVRGGVRLTGTAS